VSLSRDGRTLLVEQELSDGDLWMLEIPGRERGPARVVRDPE
jgi:hypothetical protein